MYEYRGLYGHANTVFTHGKDEDDLCMVVNFYPINDSLPNSFSVKARVLQSLDIPLDCFPLMQQ